MVKKICKFRGCNNLIDKPKKYCEEHKFKEMENLRFRNKLYDEERKATREWKFYKSKNWKKIRDLVLIKSYGLDIYELKINNKFLKANVVHHIKEVKEAWDERLDLDNLIPLNEKTHNKIHAIYNSNLHEKIKLQEKLKEILKEASPPTPK